MPLWAAVIAALASLAAVRLLFMPTAFVGLHPKLGWQGVVPRWADRVVAGIRDSLSARPIAPTDVYGPLDREHIAREIERPLLATLNDLADAIALHHDPGRWPRAPATVRALLSARVRADLPGQVAPLLRALHAHPAAVLDLNELVSAGLLREQRLLDRLGAGALGTNARWVGAVALVGGSVLGVIEALLWTRTQHPWLLPLFGALIGAASSGAVLLLLLRRRPSATPSGPLHTASASAYSTRVADHITTPAHLIRGLLLSPASDALFIRAQKHLRRLAEAGYERPAVIVYAVGSPQYQIMKAAVIERLLPSLSAAELNLPRLAAPLRERLSTLTAQALAALPRAAQDHEIWMLSAVGAVIGLAAGALQMQVALQWAALGS